MTDTASIDLDAAASVFVDPGAYTDEARLHAALARLRRESPVHRVEAPGYAPFLAVTRHADVVEVESHLEFLSVPAAMLMTLEEQAMRRERGDPFRSMLRMDEPEHRRHRAVTADWFLPKTLSRYEARLAELARRAVDRMAETDTCDFARETALPFPMQAILEILGLPEEDYPFIRRMTEQLLGGEDPELAPSGDRRSGLTELIAEASAYFEGVTADRRAHPGPDLASVIANATVDGRPLGYLETFGYYMIIAGAGFETTGSSIAGGMQALIEHPTELDRLRAEPELMPSAVDEMIRWVSPVKHFCRTASVPWELSGTRIEPGDWLLLSYPSANRDEAVFDEPFRFDVGRRPNRHVAFGHGVHFCLGAQFARMEMRAFFSELVPRLEHAELAGRPELTRTQFVGGLKHLPIRYSLRS